MKKFCIKLVWQSAVFILISLIKPLLAKYFGESFFAPIDYFWFTCVGAYFLVSIWMAVKISEKKILSFKNCLKQAKFSKLFMITFFTNF